MSDHTIAFVISGLLALVAWRFITWGNRILKASGRKEFPAFRHGGWLAQLAILSFIGALAALVTGIKLS